MVRYAFLMGEPMQFKGHVVGAMAAGTLSATLAALLVTADDPLAAQLGFYHWPGFAPGGFSPEWMLPPLCFLIAVAMALFPDLDIGSIPQRWFLRVMFLAMGAAWAMDRPQVFTMLAFAALAPMLHRHRGWTHWLLTPWLIAAGVIWILEPFPFPFGEFENISTGEILSNFNGYGSLIFAIVAGHYTHLLLDARGLYFFSFLTGRGKRI